MDEKKIIANYQYGNLIPKWFWRQHNGENVWKCTCLSCNKPCYVKERALTENLVFDCGCSIRVSSEYKMLSHDVNKSITYQKLWDILKDRDITKNSLMTDYHITQWQLGRLQKNQYVPYSLIEKLCSILNCKPNDIMERTPINQAPSQGRHYEQ